MGGTPKQTMKSEGNTAPAASVLSGLKDFQRQTAEYAFERLFNAPDSTRRFLVADEVGLGKTLVAAGVIGLTVEHLQALGTPRVDIIYICSNQAIARQNVSRLKHLLGIEAEPLASRITLLPYRLKALENPVNLIALSPGNIFRIGLSRGCHRRADHSLPPAQGGLGRSGAPSSLGVLGWSAISVQVSGVRGMVPGPAD